MDKDIEDLSNLIYSIARTFTQDEDLIKDLYQEAVIGIINAKKNYDKNSNVKFSTYARMYIYGEIYKYFNGDKTFKVNKEIIKLYKLILKTTEYLSQELKKEPSIKEVSNYLNIDEEVINNTIMIMKNTLSLDYVYDDESNLYRFERVEDNYRKLYISELLEGLSEEEKRVIMYKYLDGYSQSEIASMLNKSQSSISRIEKDSINKIRVRSKQV